MEETIEQARKLLLFVTLVLACPLVLPVIVQMFVGDEETDEEG